MMKVAVGCPIRDRAWIVKDWIEHVRVAFEVAGLRPHWVFGIGIGPDGDDGTAKIVTDIYKTDNGMWTIIHEPKIPHDHSWGAERYEQMADYRNQTLAIVQAVNPDYFWSLDSDILAHPTALAMLLETISRPQRVRGEQKMYDAVGGKTYLSRTGRQVATWGNHEPGGGMRRHDEEGVFPCDILMAIKLMTPAAYHIPYAYHRLGEDLGWSANCRAAGLQLGWDGRVASKHVMEREDVGKIDPRLGW